MSETRPPTPPEENRNSRLTGQYRPQQEQPGGQTERPTPPATPSANPRPAPSAPIQAPPANNPELDRLLVEMHVRLRQEQYDEVKSRLAKAKAIAPGHPAVLEIEGDLAFAQRRFKQAELLFKSALEADPGNARLEEKFATALLKVMAPQYSVNQIPDDVDSIWSNRVARPPWASGLLSAFLPGLGQFYNGDLLKGLILVMVDILFWGMVLKYAGHVSGEIKKEMGSVPTGVFINHLLRSIGLPMLLLLTAAWAYSVIDAIMTALSMRQSRTLF